MIYEFALEPALVAAWHDRRVAYPFLSQMGLGQRRVACGFPSAAWRNLIMDTLETMFENPRSPEAQTARRNVDALLRHLHETGTRRTGRLADGDSWLTTATREHGSFPFGGIIVRTGDDDQPHLVVADRMTDQEFAAWSPPARPVLRQPEELARALAPVLRCATQLRFIDPFFDPEVAAFLDPMRHYLRVAQTRRTVGDLRVQIHLSINREQAEQRARILGQRVTEVDLARTRLTACERHLQPLLQSGATLQAFAWGVGPTGLRMHNRYVLSEIGGVAVQHGLDRGGVAAETDDLTVLSKEQYERRWSEYQVGSRVYGLLEQGTFAGR